MASTAFAGLTESRFRIAVASITILRGHDHAPVSAHPNAPQVGTSGVPIRPGVAHGLWRGRRDANGDWFTITASSGGSGTLGSYYMEALTQEWRDAAASFRNNNPRFIRQNGTFNIGGTVVFANPLQSSRVDYAHALGLTGAGQVIAIVDAGFRRTHEAFAGKSNTVTGNPASLDTPNDDGPSHGTMVASVAAGNSNSMVGVAPRANLIFSDWGADTMLDLARRSQRSAQTPGRRAEQFLGLQQHSCDPREF